jgi:hypothetical protein
MSGEGRGGGGGVRRGVSAAGWRLGRIFRAPDIAAKAYLRSARSAHKARCANRSARGRRFEFPIRPLDVGFIDDDDGLAVERRADRFECRRIEQIRRRIVRRAQIHQFDIRSLSGQQPFGVESPAPRAIERGPDDLGALNARHHLVHAEGRRALQNGVDARTQIDAREWIDGFIAAVRCEHARQRHTAVPIVRSAPGAGVRGND